MRAYRFQRRIHNGLRARALALERKPALPQAPHVEQLAQHDLHDSGLAADHAGGTHLLLPNERLGRQQFGRAADRGERIAQVVRKHSEKAVLRRDSVFRGAARSLVGASAESSSPRLCSSSCCAARCLLWSRSTFTSLITVPSPLCIGMMRAAAQKREPSLRWCGRLSAARPSASEPPQVGPPHKSARGRNRIRAHAGVALPRNERSYRATTILIGFNDQCVRQTTSRYKDDRASRRAFYFLDAP
jgi:hypothetical protein